MKNIRNVLIKNNKEYLKYSEFLEYIDNFGLDINDKYLDNIVNTFKNNKNKLSFDKFIEMVNLNSVIFQKICENNFVIPDWKLFINEIEKIIDEVKDINKGNNASYIPQLLKLILNFFLYLFAL